MEKKGIIIVGTTLLFAAIILFFAIKPVSTGNVIAGEKTTIVENTETIKIPLSEISTKANFQSYNSKGTEIEYFIVKAKDGSIKTAFNACDVCYNSKKGYRQEGGDMICNNCGNHYAISGLGTKNRAGGGCWPGYLPSKVEGGYLVIKKSDIETGRYRFE